jgi:hypothetical protein
MSSGAFTLNATSSSRLDTTARCPS